MQRLAELVGDDILGDGGSLAQCSRLDRISAGPPTYPPTFAFVWLPLLSLRRWSNWKDARLQSVRLGVRILGGAPRGTIAGAPAPPPYPPARSGEESVSYLTRALRALFPPGSPPEPPAAPIPQWEPLPGQVPNSAGGHAWPIDDWTRLRRFLVLGAEGGTYYISELKLTLENAAAVRRCVQADGPRTVREIVETSTAGRPPSNDPALFALAICASEGSPDTKAAAFAALPSVARIGTHLFHFASYVDGMRGWGRGLRSAVADWYLERGERDLAYQITKYPSRDGWSHRDLLRLSHPKAFGEMDRLLRHAVGKPVIWEEPTDTAVYIAQCAALAEDVANPSAAAARIAAHRLPREVVPTEMLRHGEVWEALLADMPVSAMIRNLATMTRVGLLTPTSDATRRVVDELGDAGRIRAARVHPIAVLAALKTYAQGRGERGHNTWEPLGQIVGALDAAFYASFGNVEPTGKRFCLGLDVSGSMAGTLVNGIPGLEARVACGAMALVTAAVEPQHAFVAFDTRAFPLSISGRQRLDDVVKLLASTGGGGTDCAIPITWALQKRLPVDVFVILTDSETWQGSIHPADTVRQYRRAVNPDAKLAVVAMASNQFSLADPDDSGMLNVVGFDTATPGLLADFAVGRI